jgi:hypothetical protein
MSSGGITPRLERRVRADFGDEADAILAVLTDLRPPLAEKQSPERIAAAIVLLADGDPEAFARAVSIANRDWRDVLVATGLAGRDWPARLDAALGR